MEFLSSVAAFVVAVGILVAVHEFGHFWVARRLGVRVLKFSVGFGRPLWSRTAADGTEYAIGILPLGGYVKMLDENDEEGAQGASEEELERAFNRQSLGARSAIVLAGPFFNFLFAAFAWWLLFMVGVSGLKAVVGEVAPGSPGERAGLRTGDAVVAVEGREARTWSRVIQTTLGGALGRDQIEFEWETPEGDARAGEVDLRNVTLDDLAGGEFFPMIGIAPALPSSPPILGTVVAGESAERAGLRPGDRVVRAGGEPIASWSEWVDFVRERPDIEFEVEVQRAGGESAILMLRPAALENDNGTIGRIGATLAPEAAVDEADWYVTERRAPLEAAGLAVVRTWDVTALTLGVLWKMVRLEVSSEHLSGPITIARYASASASGGFTDFMQFLAVISISLGIINLLPIPVLDGGHLVLHLAEAIKGSPLSERALALGQQAGIVFIVGLMGLALYNDFVRLFT